MNHVPKSKVEEFYGRLKRQIVMSELLPGQQLTELELANALGCSQSTVREVLLRLQDDGLIVRQGYRGTSVTSVSSTEVRLLLDLRMTLEVEAVRRAMPTLLPEHVEHLKELVRDMERAANANDEHRLFEIDLEFHTYLFLLANMPVLVPILTRCSILGFRNKIALTNMPRTLLESARRHWKIIDALEAGNLGEVIHVLRHHVRSIKDMDSGHEPVEPTQEEMSSSMRTVYTHLLQENGDLPDITTRPIEQGRAQFATINTRWNSIDDTLVSLEEFSIPANPVAAAATPSIPAIRITPKGAAPETLNHLLYIHGGGWVFGTIASHRGAMARLARMAGCAVIGIEYAQPPAFPFPSPLNDCTWSWRWLRANVKTSGSWYAGGDSSGANLTLAMMLDLRNTGEIAPDAALLFYGVFDSEHTTESHRLYGQGDFGLTTARMAWYRDLYLSGDRRNENNPRVSPLRADLSGLPPLLVTAAGLDPLRDDSVRLAQKLSMTNTRFNFKTYPGVIHGFMQMASVLPEAQEAFSDAAAFLQSQNTFRKT